MKKLKDRSKKILLGLAIAFVVYSLAGFLLLPYVVKRVAAGKLSENLHRETTIESVYFNPYSFLLIMRGFRVREPNTPDTFASFEELRINLQGRSLIKGGITVKELTLDGPYLRVVHNTDLSYNFSDLIPKPSAKKAPETPAKGSMKFSFNNIHITNGSVDFNDIPKKKAHAIREITAGIPFISSIPSEVEIFVKPSFSAKVNGAPFDFKGETKPFTDSFETSVDINLRDLNLPGYLAYSPVELGFRMPSGKLTADLALSYVQYKDRSPLLSVKGALRFSDIVLQEPDGGRITSLPGLAADIASVDVFGRKARISSLVFDRPSIDIVRKKDGKLNIMSLIPRSSGEKAVEKKEPSGPAFALDIDSIAVRKARLSVADRTRPAPFSKNFEPVDITLNGFTTAPDRPSKLRFDFKNPSGESVLADGTVAINPVKADLRLDVRDIDIRPVQSYLDDLLKITITKGYASASGAVAASYTPGEGLKSSYRGSSVITKFATIDKLHKDAFAKWDSLALDGIEFDLSPMRVVVKSVVLSNFYSNMVVESSGGLNIREVMSGPSEAPKPAGQKPAARQASAKAADVRIDSITLKGGKVDFRDRHIEPVFSTSLDGLTGKVKGLYLNGSKTAELSMAGKVDRYAPFEVAGSLNPKKDELFVDMRLQLTGLDLSSVSPYSGRFIGYRIEKGKIFLNLNYLIEQRKLQARNGVLIDQITLGERVDSPQATKLPVSFAISLLKDRRGEIKLNLPLSGSIDSPDFSVGGIILQVIFNLIEKAVTSPFALLGEIFGGGEELGYVVFAPGSYSIDEAAVKKLDTLASALYDRPSLKLDIEGFVSVDEDAASLKENKFMKALKAEKLNEIVKNGQTAVPVDEVVIKKDEFEKYLWLAYKKADFKKETYIFGIPKKLPPAELERLLREHTKVTDDDLRDLAALRSNSIKDYILKTGKVEQSRVFVLWPKTLSPAKKEGIRDSRAEFKLE